MGGSCFICTEVASRMQCVCAGCCCSHLVAVRAPVQPLHPSRWVSAVCCRFLNGSNPRDQSSPILMSLHSLTALLPSGCSWAEHGASSQPQPRVPKAAFCLCGSPKASERSRLHRCCLNTLPIPYSSCILHCCVISITSGINLLPGQHLHCLYGVKTAHKEHSDLLITA